MLIAENATNLGTLPDVGFPLSAVPPMIVWGASFRSARSRSWTRSISFVDISIRPLPKEGLDAFYLALSHSFGHHEDPKEAERERLVVESDRMLGAFDGPQIVGGASAVTFRLTVPGATLPAAGVTGVGVVPTHRRRGIMTALMRRQLDDIHERGEPLALLHASEAQIYGRFGYGMTSQLSVLSIERPYTAMLGRYEPRQVRLLSRADALSEFPKIYDRVAPEQPGMVARNEAWWEYRIRDIEEDPSPGSQAPFFALAKGPDGGEGYAIYQMKPADWSDGTPNGVLEVVELVAATREAYAALWSYCFSVDLIERVTAWLRPPDEPLVHMLVDPRRMKFRLRDATWARIVDAPAALAGRRYATTDRVVLEVRDAFCPWNEARFEVEGSPDGASCTPTMREPDLVLSAEELGAIFLGGTRVETLWRAGRLDEVTPGAVRRADAMFAWQPQPWSPMMF